MSFRVRNLPPAESEAVEAALWYERQASGLGAKFLTALDDAIRKCAVNPTLFRVRFADVRRVALQGFPFYGAYYVIRADEIWVISIHHGRRDPGSLKARRE